MQEAFETQQQNLDALAEKFARINFDDVEPYYEEALKLFKDGKVDEAIEKLESANPAQRTEQILKEEKRIVDARAELDSQWVALEREKKKQIEAVRLLADMYSLKFDPVKAEAQYDQLVRLDSTDLDILWNAANFYRENHRYDKALRLYPNIIYHPKAEVWQTATANAFLGELYTNTGNLPNALKVFKQYSFVYDTLSEASPHYSFYKNNLAISYSKLGSTYTSLGQLDSALVYYDQYRYLEQELYEAYPQNVNFKNGLALSFQWLGWFYEKNLNDPLEAKKYYQESKILLLELVSDFPQNTKFKRNLTWVENRLKR